VGVVERGVVLGVNDAEKGPSFQEAASKMASSDEEDEQGPLLHLGAPKLKSMSSVSVVRKLE
jgi:hypothetical protein